MEKYKEQTEEKNVALFFRYIISLFGSNINIIYHIFFSEKRARNNWYFFGNNPSIAVIFSIFSRHIPVYKFKFHRVPEPYFPCHRLP